MLHWVAVCSDSLCRACTTPGRLRLRNAYRVVAAAPPRQRCPHLCRCRCSSTRICTAVCEPSTAAPLRGALGHPSSCVRVSFRGVLALNPLAWSAAAGLGAPLQRCPMAVAVTFSSSCQLSVRVTIKSCHMVRVQPTAALALRCVPRIL